MGKVPRLIEEAEEYMLTIILTVFHIIVSVFLILVILLQTGKGADIGSMFGGGSSNTVFGSSGAGGFLSNMTKYGAIAFLVNCLVLAYMSGQTGSSVIDQLEKEQAAQEQVALPEETAPAANSETAIDVKTADGTEAGKTADGQAAVEKEADVEKSETGKPEKSEAKSESDAKTDTKKTIY
jgi:preprotein translocase subunit SecG